MSVKNLFIVKEQGVNNFIKKILNYYNKEKIVTKELYSDNNEENHLLLLTKVEKKVKSILENIEFSKIHDISDLSNSKIINYLLNDILDFTSLKIANEEVNYNYIYIYKNGTFEKYNINTIKSNPLDLFSENRFYNHGGLIKDYCGFYGSSCIAIEHGLFWGNMVSANQYKEIYPAIMTFGDYRYDYLSKQTQQDIIKIGPYINYAKNLYPDKFMEYLKKYLGKTLLVFPAHSTWAVNINYDIDTFIDYIEKISKRYSYDSVIVCMYSRDVEIKISKKYEEKGYIIVTCGNRYDSNFMNKLKTIINLSDYVLSNRLGTYLGYSIFLNKPFSIYIQQINESGRGIDGFKRNTIKFNEFEEVYKVQLQEFEEVFKDYNEDISKSQYELVNLYWGFDYIKTKEEIKSILDYYNKI